MTVAAARLLWPSCVCFVGIGVPAAAGNLARLTHAKGIVLIYESEAIGTKPVLRDLHARSRMARGASVLPGKTKASSVPTIIHSNIEA